MSRSIDTAGSRFVFDYDPGELRCGRGCVSDLGAVLDDRDLEGTLVVTGSNVGANRDVMNPVETGLGNRPIEVFAETTPEKYLATGLDGAERVRSEGFDAVVAVGSGSSLDVAKVISALGSHDDLERAAERSIETGTVAVADDGDPTPILAVPTTLAGADLSVIAGVNLSLDPSGVSEHEIPNGSASDRRLMPTALFYDLALFETTPKSVLCSSAMNGFDKAVECLYSPHSTPITDGTAMRGLSLMQSGFETLPDEEMNDRQLYQAVSGLVLAQYGISTPGTYRASIIHAFGHGFSRDYDVHQGTVHGIVAPYVLELVFDRVDGRRDLLAEAFGVDGDTDGDDETAAGSGTAVVDAVAAVRDDLGLPSRLRDLDELSRAELPGIAARIRADGLLSVSPVEPTEEEILGVLEAAW